MTDDYQRIKAAIEFIATRADSQPGLDEVAAHIVETLVALDRRDEALERLVEAEALTPDSELLKDVRDRLFPDAP